MDTGIKVRDLMTKRPITVKVTTSLQDCAKIMEQEHVGSLVVLDNRGSLFGIVTEQDIVRKAVAKGLNSDSHIKAIVERRLYTISPEKDVFEAIENMSVHNVRHLPVLVNNNFAGFITIKDILKIQPQLFELLVDTIELKEQDKKLNLQTYGDEFEL